MLEVIKTGLKLWGLNMNINKIGKLDWLVGIMQGRDGGDVQSCWEPRIFYTIYLGRHYIETWALNRSIDILRRTGMNFWRQVKRRLRTSVELQWRRDWGDSLAKTEMVRPPWPNGWGALVIPCLGLEIDRAAETRTSEALLRQTRQGDGEAEMVIKGIKLQELWILKRFFPEQSTYNPEFRNIYLGPIEEKEKGFSYGRSLPWKASFIILIPRLDENLRHSNTVEFITEVVCLPELWHSLYM